MIKEEEEGVFLVKLRWVCLESPLDFVILVGKGFWGLQGEEQELGFNNSNRLEYSMFTWGLLYV